MVRLTAELELKMLRRHRRVADCWKGFNAIRIYLRRKTFPRRLSSGGRFPATNSTLRILRPSLRRPSSSAPLSRPANARCWSNIDLSAPRPPDDGMKTERRSLNKFSSLDQIDRNGVFFSARNLFDERRKGVRSGEENCQNEAAEARLALSAGPFVANSRSSILSGRLIHSGGGGAARMCSRILNSYKMHDVRKCVVH